MGSYHNGASYLREILFDTVFLREIFIATVFLWHTLDLNLALFIYCFLVIILFRGHALEPP